MELAPVVRSSAHANGISGEPHEGASWWRHASRLPHGCQTGRMSELKDRLRADLTASMKARDAVASSTLRMLLTGGERVSPAHIGAVRQAWFVRSEVEFVHTVV